ncbi:uncharacterized protein LOC127793251 [Diospyros lotus]|uniref:uncharacterized protein LOC127793251 n=1 Tax=Diospyros lotus TaxID=55363 RepID=UPI002256763A|nr:uncharacterized protein LOC127793251 [Diospyros lotus]
MERSEPTLVPEWLKGSGSVSGTGTMNHQSSSSLLHSDDLAASKPSRSKSSLSTNDNDIGRSFVSDRTTSSYFRRSSSSSSSSNGSAYSRSHGSFSRTNRNRDWENEIYDFRDKEKSGLGDHRRHDYSDPLENILPSRFEKDLRRSQSMISGKRGETWPKKVPSNLSNANKGNPNKSGALPAGTNTISTIHKSAFERDFPSLGVEERQGGPEIGRVSSPGLCNALHSLPLGSSAVIGGDGWTALAEVPVAVGNNGTAGAVQQAIPPTSVSLPSTSASGMNMAETLAQGPTRAHTTPPQLSAGTHKLEELAIKQSRQLIPVMPSLPKTLVPKVGQQQQPHQISSSSLVNHSPRGEAVKSDVSRMSSGGKLHVLKPARERNGVTPAVKESLSSPSVSRVASSPVAASPSVSAPLRSTSNNRNPSSAERKPVLSIFDKRSTSQSRSRNDFFNLVRKKSMTTPSSCAASASHVGPAVPSSVTDKSDETETDCATVMPQGGDSPTSNSYIADGPTKRNDVCSNDVAFDRHSLNSKHQGLLNNGKDHSGTNAFLWSEEEEIAFLYSLGWEENAGKDEGALTEEEISSFYKEVDECIKRKPSLRMRLKFL